MEYNRTVIVEANSLNKLNEDMTSNDFVVTTPNILIPRGATIELDGSIIEERSAGNDSVIELSNFDYSEERPYNSSYQMIKTRYYLNNNGLNSICQPMIQTVYLNIGVDPTPPPEGNRWPGIARGPNEAVYVCPYKKMSTRITQISGPNPFGIIALNDDLLYTGSRWLGQGMKAIAYKNPYFLNFNADKINPAPLANGNWDGNGSVQADGTTIQTLKLLDNDSTPVDEADYYQNGGCLYGMGGIKTALRRNQPDSKKYTYMKAGYVGPDVTDEIEFTTQDANTKTNELEIFYNEISFDMKNNLLETPDELAQLINVELQNSKVNNPNNFVNISGQRNTWSYTSSTDNLYRQNNIANITNISSKTLFNITANFQGSPPSPLKVNETCSEFTATNTNMVQGTYTDITGLSSKKGFGATFFIIVNATPAIASISVFTEGSNYIIGEDIMINETELGGADSGHPLIINVTANMLLNYKSSVYGEGFFCKDPNRWISGNAFLKINNRRQVDGFYSSGFEPSEFKTIMEAGFEDNGGAGHPTESSYELMYDQEQMNSENPETVAQLMPCLSGYSCSWTDIWFDNCTTDGENMHTNKQFGWRLLPNQTLPTTLEPFEWNPDTTTYTVEIVTNNPPRNVGFPHNFEGTKLSTSYGRYCGIWIIRKTAPVAPNDDLFFFIGYDFSEGNGSLRWKLTPARIDVPTDSWELDLTPGRILDYVIDVGHEDIYTTYPSEYSADITNRLSVYRLSLPEKKWTYECVETGTSRPNPTRTCQARDIAIINGLPYNALGTSFGGGRLGTDEERTRADGIGVVALPNPPYVTLSYIGGLYYTYIGNGFLNTTSTQFEAGGDAGVFVANNNHLFNTQYYRNVIVMMASTAPSNTTPLANYFRIVSFRDALEVGLTGWDNDVIADGGLGINFLDGKAYNPPPIADNLGVLFLMGSSFSIVSDGTTPQNVVVSGVIEPKSDYTMTNNAGYSYRFELGGEQVPYSPANIVVDEYLCIPQNFLIPTNFKIRQFVGDDQQYTTGTLNRIAQYMRMNEKYYGTETDYEKQQADIKNWAVDFDVGFADDFNNAYSNYLSSKSTVAGTDYDWTIYDEEQNFSMALPWYSTISSKNIYGEGIGTTKIPPFDNTAKIYRGYNFRRSLLVYPISRYAKMGSVYKTQENYIRVYSRYNPNQEIRIDNDGLGGTFSQLGNTGQRLQFLMPFFKMTDNPFYDEKFKELNINCKVITHIRNGGATQDLICFINFRKTMGGTGVDSVLYDPKVIDANQSDMNPEINYRQCFRLLAYCPFGFDPASTTNPFSNASNLNQNTVTNPDGFVQSFYSDQQLTDASTGFPGIPNGNEFPYFTVPCIYSNRIEDYQNQIWLGAVAPTVNFNNSRMEFTSFFSPRQFNSEDAASGSDPNIGLKIAYFNDPSKVFHILNNTIGSVPDKNIINNNTSLSGINNPALFKQIFNKGICDEISGFGIEDLFVRGQNSIATTEASGELLKCILNDDGSTTNYKGCLFNLFGFDLKQFKPRYGEPFNRYEEANYGKTDEVKYDGVSYFCLNAFINQSNVQNMNIFGPNFQHAVINDPTHPYRPRAFPLSISGRPAYLNGYVGFQPATIQVDTDRLRSENLPAKLQNAFYLIMTNLPNSRYVTNNSEMNVIGYFYRNWKSGNHYFSYPTSYTKTITDQFNLTNIRIAILNQNGLPAEHLGEKVSCFFKINIPTSLPEPTPEEAEAFAEAFEDPELNDAIFENNPLNIGQEVGLASLLGNAQPTRDGTIGGSSGSQLANSNPMFGPQDPVVLETLANQNPARVNPNFLPVQGPNIENYQQLQSEIDPLRTVLDFPILGLRNEFALEGNLFQVGLEEGLPTEEDLLQQPEQKEEQEEPVIDVLAKLFIERQQRIARERQEQEYLNEVEKQIEIAEQLPPGVGDVNLLPAPEADGQQLTNVDYGPVFQKAEEQVQEQVAEAQPARRERLVEGDKKGEPDEPAEPTGRRSGRKRTPAKKYAGSFEDLSPGEQEREKRKQAKREKKGKKDDGGEAQARRLGEKSARSDVTGKLMRTPTQQRRAKEAGKQRSAKAKAKRGKSVERSPKYPGPLTSKGTPDMRFKVNRDFRKVLESGGQVSVAKGRIRGKSRTPKPKKGRGRRERSESVRPFSRREISELTQQVQQIAQPKQPERSAVPPQEAQKRVEKPTSS